MNFTGQKIRQRENDHVSYDDKTNRRFPYAYINEFKQMKFSFVFSFDPQLYKVNDALHQIWWQRASGISTDFGVTIQLLMICSVQLY